MGKKYPPCKRRLLHFSLLIQFPVSTNNITYLVRQFFSEKILLKIKRKNKLFKNFCI